MSRGDLLALDAYKVSVPSFRKSECSNLASHHTVDVVINRQLTTRTTATRGLLH